jgi:hypothetical protein
MVWASLLKALLEVFRGWPCLMLAIAYNNRGGCHARAARLLAIADVIAACGCGLQKTLLAPLLVAPGAFPDVLDSDIG